MAETLANPRRTPLRRLWTWLVGFLATGRVFHGLTAYDLRRLPRKRDRIAVNLAGMAAVVAVAYWLLFLVPPVITVLIVVVPAVWLVYRTLLITLVTAVLVAWLVTRHLGERSLEYAARAGLPV